MYLSPFDPMSVLIMRKYENLIFENFGLTRLQCSNDYVAYFHSPKNQKITFQEGKFHFCKGHLTLIQFSTLLMYWVTNLHSSLKNIFPKNQFSKLSGIFSFRVDNMFILTNKQKNQLKLPFNTNRKNFS